MKTTWDSTDTRITLHLGMTTLALCLACALVYWVAQMLP